MGVFLRRVISTDPVGAESRSDLIGLVVKVVCLGYQPLDCMGGVRGDVRVFFSRGCLGFSVHVNRRFSARSG